MKCPQEAAELTLLNLLSACSLFCCSVCLSASLNINVTAHILLFLGKYTRSHNSSLPFRLLVPSPSPTSTTSLQRCSAQRSWQRKSAWTALASWSRSASHFTLHIKYFAAEERKLKRRQTSEWRVCPDTVLKLPVHVLCCSVQITGCTSPGKTVSIVVRGSNKLVIEEAERSIHDALCVIRCLVKKRSVGPFHKHDCNVFSKGERQTHLSLPILMADKVSGSTDNL